MLHFIRGYIECALWSSSDDEGESLDGHTLSTEARASLERFAEGFARDNADLLARAVCVPGYAWEHAGHDLWLTQNHHGAGYWDGDLPDDIGDALTDAAHKWREYYLYIGDDGLVYVG
jgi:hypothetical protein